MAWLELCLGVDEESAEAVAEVLAQYGYQGGVAFELPVKAEAGDVWPAEFTRSDLPSPCQSSGEFPIVLRTYLPLDDRTEDIRGTIERALWHLHQIRPIGKLHTRVIQEQDWEQSWKQYYHVQHLASRTVIVPSWLTYQPAAGEIVVQLDPGMAFGTGLHPTTRLCIQLLERVMRPGQRVLDVGCGSGILSIAAAKLGAGAVLALDTDPLAVRVARENVERNGVDAQVQVIEGSLPVNSSFPMFPTGHPPTFDVVVANIIASVLCDLASEMAQALAPEGWLVSSGILREREEEVNAAYASVGLHRCERQVEGDWVALLHRHAAAAR